LNYLLLRLRLFLFRYLIFILHTTIL
jgi:hypothetical protein